ncbi:MAG: twin-arginine translocation signal domain-containing protein [Thermoflavifilum aggregans]|nr:twin-arginine translocation signal domain-containing protein [Thermoflavifilum aggregans]
MKSENNQFSKSKIKRTEEMDSMQNFFVRRDFLKIGIAAAAGLMLPSFSFGQSRLYQ